MKFVRFTVLCGATALAALIGAAVPPAARADDKPYQVVDGKVDQGTYNGYRRFGEACLRCHGQGGVGSSFAPNLTESLQRLSYEQFSEIVINGKQDLSAGQEKVMPSFGLVQDVALYLDDIYAYLKARSDGVIGTGRPQRIGR